MDEYLRIDEYEDVDASTVFLIEALNRAKQSDIYWKQVLIFTYLIVQGVAVCCLTRSDLTGPFDKKTEQNLRIFLNMQSQKAVNEANNAPWEMPDLDYPQERLANFDELLARLPEKHRVRISGKSRKTANDREWSFIFVRNWRNDFSHFGPKHLSILRSDIAGHCKTCLEHTLQLVENPGAFSNKSQFDQTNVASNLRRAISLL